MQQLVTAALTGRGGLACNKDSSDASSEFDSSDQADWSADDEKEAPPIRKSMVAVEWDSARDDLTDFML